MLGWEVPVVDFLYQPGDRTEYEYDFGDSWSPGARPEQTIEPDTPLREFVSRAYDGLKD